jgi:molybdate transport system substrate-binding protein
MFTFPAAPRACFLALLALAIPSKAAELTVFAAASLADAFKTLAPAYTAATGDTLRFNFGASGTLARQIKEGAPADVIVFADELRLDQLANGGLLLPGTRRTILANTLVLVVATDNTTIKTLADLAQPGVRRIAFGAPATVPIGTYAKEYLDKLKLWEPLQPKAVFLDNVRAVLATVESGNAEAGIVYKTDALSSKKVKIAVAVPLAEGPSITYPAAVVKNGKSPESAKKFVAWLACPEAQGVFANCGFLPSP